MIEPVLPGNEPARLAALHGLGILYTPAEERFDRLRAAVRPYDAIGRYGGEEFLIVLSSCGTDAASKIGEKIRSRVGLAPIELAGDRMLVTMSLGVASSDATGMDPLALIAAADSALYRAKAAGRDRVELSM